MSKQVRRNPFTAISSMGASLEPSGGIQEPVRYPLKTTRPGRKGTSSGRLLVIAAHPDDEVLGCGGTIACAGQRGWDAHVLLLGEGITSRFDDRSLASKSLLESLRAQSRRANRLLGVHTIHSTQYPDNRFDEVGLLTLVKTIERVKAFVRPHWVLIHHPSDTNVDHRLAHEASLIAFRPLPGEDTRAVLAFEVLGSQKHHAAGTEGLNPNFFVDISKVLKKKQAALAAYTGEIRRYPHPRSREGVRIWAQARGLASGMAFSEAFQVIRLCAPLARSLWL